MVMGHTWRFNAFLIVVLSCFLLMAEGNAAKRSDRSLRLATSIYTGWMPWFLAGEDGTLKRHASKYGLDIQVVSDDYLETIHMFIDGKADAVTLTNVDAKAFLVGEKVASDVVLISSFSHGNDAVLLRPDAAGDPTRGPLGLVEFSVSHYLLDRYLERENIAQDQVERRNISDSELSVTFESRDSELMGVVTWNPIVSQIEHRLNVVRVFDSRWIEGEIADMLVVRREVLKRYPEFAQALLKTWFEMMKRMRGPEKFQTFAALGALTGTSGEAYEKELTTTLLIRTPEVGLGYLRDPFLVQTMGHVRAFVDRHMFIKEPPPEPWVSYPGKKPALLHFNERPLLKYMRK